METNKKLKKKIGFEMIVVPIEKEDGSKVDLFDDPFYRGRNDHPTVIDDEMNQRRYYDYYDDCHGRIMDKDDLILLD